MFTLRVVQAEQGDCLMVEFGAPAHPRYILIDGGPESTYERHLRREVQEVRRSGGRLDLVILSHVDNDHVIGLLDLLAELREQRTSGVETLPVTAIWHNSFSRTIGSGNDIEPRLRALLSQAGAAAQVMVSTGMAVEGIREGNQLRLAATTLSIPINPGFAHDLISVEEIQQPVIMDNLRLRVVGPTHENLDELRQKWMEWLETHGENVASGDPQLAAMADRSVPNLSSIMILAEGDGKSVLLTGDGRGDHLLQGLRQAGLLTPQGTFHVNILKVPHHGSDRNITKKFLSTVTADTYVISANGRDDNPSLDTLTWIVEVARERGQRIEIVVTNETPFTRRLVREHDPGEFGYRLRPMRKGAHSLRLRLAD